MESLKLDLSLSGLERLHAWHKQQAGMLRRGGISFNKRQKLIDLGMVPSTRTRVDHNSHSLRHLASESWDKMFELCKAFAARHGHFNVAQGLPRVVWQSRRFENYQLYDWMNTQRDHQRKGTLSHERAQKLNSIGFTWNPQKEYWLNTFNAYKRDPENPRFSRWCTSQRRYKVDGTLSEERIKLLDSIGFSWGMSTCETRQQEWDRFCRELADYVNRFGTISIPRELYGLTRICWQLDEETKARLQAAFPQEQVKFIPLSAWLRKQIAGIRNGTIKTGQLDRLTEVFSHVRFGPKSRFLSARIKALESA